MPQTWLNALNKYKYPDKCYDLPSNLSDLSHAFFLQKGYNGDRGGTIAFENYFRQQAPYNPKVWHEVALWKIYSQADRKAPLRSVYKIQQNVVSRADAERLWQLIQRFNKLTSEADKKATFKELRKGLGLKYRIAVALTFIAFAAPDLYPMIDSKVGDWININCDRIPLLQPFKSIESDNRSGKRKRRNTTITDLDFGAYLTWVKWCQEKAGILSNHMPNIKWRARDVEMAVYTAQAQGLLLNP